MTHVDVDAALDALTDWRGETLRWVRQLVLAAAPEIVEEVKWRKPSNAMRGVPVWSSEGILCTGETYRDKVKLTFAQGAALDDPHGLFNAGLAGGQRRAIDLHEGERPEAGAFSALVCEAIEYNRASKRKRRRRAGAA